MREQSSRLPMVEADEWLHPVEEEVNRRYAMYISR